MADRVPRGRVVGRCAGGGHPASPSILSLGDGRSEPAEALGEVHPGQPLSYCAPSKSPGLADAGGTRLRSSSHRSLTRCSSVITSVLKRTPRNRNLTDRSSVRSDLSIRQAGSMRVRTGAIGLALLGALAAAARVRRKRDGPVSGTSIATRNAQLAAIGAFGRGLRFVHSPAPACRHAPARASRGAGSRIPTAQRRAGCRRAREHEGRAHEDRPDGQLSRRRSAPTRARRARIAATGRFADDPRAVRAGQPVGRVSAPIRVAVFVANGKLRASGSRPRRSGCVRIAR